MTNFEMDLYYLYGMKEEKQTHASPQQKRDKGGEHDPAYRSGEKSETDDSR
ncbi:MAG: hypothetical protein M0Z65_10345 [Firmicutes bacterium]|uniref:Uncharacterized protein n=1 Tax=Melghirimyces thermohalophilus TaxID=1236220 RepID=A0A1G6KNU9_9BACL|nr:hypothetical protein [Melghirimyces thermohalophilus]MDA8353560.1 hypothetical protein [Bacillota bacterium]SDC32215.1 hypothetical protein SAMN04488112_10662 [Melghirimyces thermohalophilus]